MTLLLVSVAVLLAALSGIPGLALCSRPVVAQRSSCALLCTAALLGVGAAIAVLAGVQGSSVQLPWNVPGGALSLRLDALSALFLVPVFGVPALGAVYGVGYWPQAKLGPKAIRLQLAYGLLTGSMALVVLAANAVLFITAWEVMAVAGFLLVFTEHEKPESQRASFLFLAATHVGTFALLALFALMAHKSGSFELVRWQGIAAARPFGAACFVLALLGFGMKSGLIPLHFWLPHAHAAAPSHVSAVLSGVMLKTGIYGLLRITGLFEGPPIGWGLGLLALGVVSAVLGVAFALGQHDLKRLLAWHSVENIGIIAMGIGLALLGRSSSDPALIMLGFAGGALHVVNHALFKSLLFLGAGSIQHGCGTRELDRLGGLARTMPITSALFLLGAAAISGLPPLNGFASEWLIGLGALQVMQRPAGDLLAFAVLALPSLAFVGGLAAACFAKVHGTVFLGQPRTEEAMHAHESPRVMLVPMAVLAGACAFIGLLPTLWVGPLARAAAVWSRLPAQEFTAIAQDASYAGLWVTLASLALLLLGAAIWYARRQLGHPVAQADTWGCGFSAPTSRMQYTASSFAQMLVRRFDWALWPETKLEPPHGSFPRRGHFHSHVGDTVLDHGILPVLRRAADLAGWLKPRLFRPRVQFHAVLVVATLVVVLAWRFVLR